MEIGKVITLVLAAIALGMTVTNAIWTFAVFSEKKDSKKRFNKRSNSDNDSEDGNDDRDF